MTSSSTPAPVASDAQDWRNRLALTIWGEIGGDRCFAIADALLSGPIAAMQAEHQQTAERLAKALEKFAGRGTPFGQKFIRVSVDDIQCARAALDPSRRALAENGRHG